MTHARLEHANISVSDGSKTTEMLIDLFGWHVRWQGSAQRGGHTFHVGNANDYIAVYTPPTKIDVQFEKSKPLNHIGIVVDNLTDVEARVVARGLKPYGHDDYDPGKRFYFFDEDGIEFEVISYV